MDAVTLVWGNDTEGRRELLAIHETVDGAARDASWYATDSPWAKVWTQTVPVAH